MRSFLGKLKRSIRNQLLLYNNYRLDHKKFIAWADPFRKFKTHNQRSAYILMLSHSIEKGLAFPKLKPWFGKKKIKALIEQLHKYQIEENHSDWIIGVSINCLTSYLKTNLASEKKNDALKNLINETINNFRPIEPNHKGGTKCYTKHDLINSFPKSNDSFFKTRFSIREFSPEPVNIGVIEDAVRLAQNSPSVCNRQAVRVHAYEKGRVANDILSCQNGNAGFGHKADKILIITSDLQCFLSIGERNQPWIDGGLFAMTLIWALHNKGLASCCLNWSATHHQDQKLRSIISLPDNELVIMLLAVGHIPNEIKVPESHRRPLNEIFRFNAN